MVLVINELIPVPPFPDVIPLAPILLAPPPLLSGVAFVAVPDPPPNPCPEVPDPPEALPHLPPPPPLPPLSPLNPSVPPPYYNTIW